MRNFYLPFLLLFVININVHSQVSLPYFNNFENDTTGWQVVNINPGSEWQWGVPYYGILPFSYSGNKCLGVGMDIGYQNNAKTILYTPVFDLTTVAGAQMKFYTKYKTESNFDGCNIEYKDDTSTTWKILNTINNFNINWYNSNGFFPMWSGTSNGWEQRACDISQFAGVANLQFRFVFNSDGVITRDGLLIDDFSISDYSNTSMDITPQLYAPPCNSPQDISIIFTASTFDTVNTTGTVDSLKIFFGDGTDTTLSFNYDSNYVYVKIMHKYTTTGNFSLQAICGVDGLPAITTTLLNAIYIDPFCGNISGKVYLDKNADCIFNNNDDSLANQLVRIKYSTGQLYYASTDSSGNYAFTVPNSLSYEVTLNNAQLPLYSIVCPNSGMYALSTLPATNIDFSLTCNTGYDLASIIHTQNVRPLIPTIIYLSFIQYSCYDSIATGKMILDSNLNFVSADVIPDSINGDTLLWQLPVSGQVLLKFIEVTVLPDSILQLGDTVCNTLIIEPIAGDIDPANNTYISCGAVTNSFDPNAKEVIPDGDIDAGQLLLYTIYFQNTGTAPALNVRIVDTLSNNLEIGSLQIINSSHSMHMNILPSRVAHFVFDNINLPDSNTNEPQSHGFVTYAVKAKTSLIGGDEIKNTAHIYFDFNSPIVYKYNI
nr:immune inhibitor A [Bacteroidota bacterium]